MALRPVSFRWDEKFVARIDAARGGLSRTEFVRRAVEELVAQDEGSRALVAMMRGRDRPNTVAESGAAIAKVFSEPLPSDPSPLEALKQPDPLPGQTTVDEQIREVTVDVIDAKGKRVSTGTVRTDPHGRPITETFRPLSRGSVRRDVKPFPKGGS